MSGRLPFTKKERRHVANSRYGHRSLCEWGMGDLPAPYAEGDIVYLAPDADVDRSRLHGQEGPYFVVTYCPSIDEGDAWYVRVWDGSLPHGSDRLHVAWSDRCTWGEDVDWMEGFALVDSADPEGLALREQMLADGWEFRPPPMCPTCGQRTGESGAVRPGAVVLLVVLALAASIPLQIHLAAIPGPSWWKVAAAAVDLAAFFGWALAMANACDRETADVRRLIEED